MNRIRRKPIDIEKVHEALAELVICELSNEQVDSNYNLVRACITEQQDMILKLRAELGQLEAYMTIALHIVQRLKLMDGEVVGEE